MRVTVICMLALVGNIVCAELPTITVEAESYTEVTGGTVRILSREAASAGKHVSYWEDPGVAVTVPFEVAEAGDYCLTLQYSLNWDDTRRSIALDGEVVAGLEDVTLPGTGGWDYFGAITLPGPEGGRVRLALTPGAHTLTLTNVDSRGLGWDTAVLHDPGLLLADAPLSEADVVELAGKLPATASRLLTGQPGEGDVVLGDAAIAFGEGDVGASWRVGDVLFSHGEAQASPAPATVTNYQLGRFALRRWMIALPVGVKFASVYLTDGSCLYLLGVAVGYTESGISMPSPMVQWRDGKPWLLDPRPMASAAQGATSLTIGDLLISAPRPVWPSLSKQPVPRLELEWAPLVIADTAVGAAKIGPAIIPGDSAIAAEIQGDEVVVRSSTEMWPALAAFYGTPQFECRVRADGSMTIVSEGEELVLPAL